MLIKSENPSFVWIHRALDFVIPTITIYLAYFIAGYQSHKLAFYFGLYTGIIVILGAQLSGLYTNWRGRRITQSIGQLILTWLFSWSIVIVSLFLFKLVDDISRAVMLIWLVTTLISLIGYRIIIRAVLAIIREKTESGKKVVIFGSGDLGKSLSSVFNSSKWMGFEVISFYDDDEKLYGSKINNIPILGSANELLAAAKNKEFDEVYICLPMRAEARIKELLNLLTDTTIVVKLVPDLFSFDLLHSQISNVRGIPIVSVYDSPFNSISAKIIKRTEDILLSFIILTLISPIMILLSIGVKLTSPGPIFYKQSRVGWSGKNFSMYKFRSMPTDTEKDGVQWGSAKSKTNTKFGKFIRETSLDELPQFINVLKGDMSIVGPRPERDIFVEQFRKEIPRYMQKHMAKAGITGWAQINGWRGDTSLEKRVEFDLYYINHWTLWLDIKIIFLTIFKGFVNKNAY